jgi:hypothetical protein
VSLSGQALDLLFIDASGRLTAVETKLRKNPESRREVVGQVIEYGSYLSAWGYDDVSRQANAYLRAKTTPERFQSEGLEEALARLEGGEEAAVAGGSDLRERVEDSLRRRDLRLVIAVDRIVDPLRLLVDYINSSSSFQLFLLEVQQYLGPAGTRIASLNVYGGRVSTSASARGPAAERWTESRFTEVLQAQAPPAARDVILRLYSFMTEKADQVKWGTGATIGSVGFAVRHAGATPVLFWANTQGRIGFQTGPILKNASAEALAAYFATLREVGVPAIDRALDKDTWLSFDAALLRPETAAEHFMAATLKLREAML